MVAAVGGGVAAVVWLTWSILPQAAAFVNTFFSFGLSALFRKGATPRRGGVRWWCPGKGGPVAVRVYVAFSRYAT